MTAIYPVLPGLGWSVHRRPNFNTIVASHASGGEVRCAMWQAPLWEFELTYDALAGDAVNYPGAGTNSLQALMGFYLLAGGQQSNFLYIDPDFNTLFGQAIGVGDGATTKFQLMRTVGGFVEPVSWSTGVGAVYLNGVLASGWSAIAPATVVFAAPPASGALVGADFTYGFICRFIDDTEDFEEFMLNLWQAKAIKFRQVRL